MLADVGNDIRMPIGAPLAANQRSRVSTAVWSAQGQWTAWSVDSADLDGIREVRMHDEESDQAANARAVSERLLHVPQSVWPMVKPPLPWARSDSNWLSPT